MKDLNIRPETLKLVQEKAGNILEARGVSKDFLSRTQVAKQLKERMGKWDYMKLKSFCTTKEMVSTLKRSPTEWEKIFASYTSDKELITKIYRELKKLNCPQINEPIKKWATELNKTFSKKEVQMVKKHMKKGSLSLAKKEIQIKTT
jgi:preprotein translocase subunit SecD